MLETSIVDAAVTGRHIFYNASSYDGASPGNAGANAADDGAIDPSKQALLPLQSTTFVNWTGYDKGINGVMVDVLGSTVDLTSLTQEELAAYFSFDTSRTGSGFVGAPDPDIIAVRAGAGVDGGDRVTFIWDTTAGPVIKNTWLRVTVDASLGLGADDVFYFGNQIGDGDGVNGSGNPATTVNSVDQLGSRENPKGGFNPAPVGFQWDYNKDKNANGTDQLIARENNTGLQHLGIFTAPMAGMLSAGNLSGGDARRRRTAGLGGLVVRRQRLVGVEFGRVVERDVLWLVGRGGRADLGGRAGRPGRLERE